MKKKTFNGFTLIEMLVSISIISLISLVFLSYSRSQESVSNLNRYSQKLVNDLKEIRNNSLNMKDCLDIASQRFVYCGWGIHFDVSNNSYFLFQDKCTSSNNGNRIYDISDRKLNSFKISHSVFLETNISDIVFEPPLPNVCFNGNCTSSGEVYLKTSNFKTKVNINPIGLITFEYVQ
ncbi:MAG: prepilin-type N-terminal cleavage/methylation domain-containing protein [Candidatus Paceibacterota bacterium]